MLEQVSFDKSLLESVLVPGQPGKTLNRGEVRQIHYRISIMQCTANTEYLHLLHTHVHIAILFKLFFVYQNRLPNSKYMWYLCKCKYIFLKNNIFRNNTAQWVHRQMRKKPFQPHACWTIIKMQKLSLGNNNEQVILIALVIFFIFTKSDFFVNKLPLHIMLPSVYLFQSGRHSTAVIFLLSWLSSMISPGLH